MVREVKKTLPPGMEAERQGYFAFAYYGETTPPNSHPSHQDPEWLEKWHKGNKEARLKLSESALR